MAPHRLTAGLGLKPQHYDGEALRAPPRPVVGGAPRKLSGRRRPAPGLARSHSRAPSGGPAWRVAVARSRCAARRGPPWRGWPPRKARVEPAIISEHLAWSTWAGSTCPDLLPFPRTQAALQRIADNIARTQDVLQRPIAIENPTHYLHIDGHDWLETEFLAEAGAAHRLRPAAGREQRVHQRQQPGFDAGRPTSTRFPCTPWPKSTWRAPCGPGAWRCAAHRQPRCARAPAVWRCTSAVIARTGPVPTLIERDDQLPAFSELLTETRPGPHALTAAQPEETPCS